MNSQVQLLKVSGIVEKWDRSSTKKSMALLFSVSLTAFFLALVGLFIWFGPESAVTFSYFADSKSSESLGINHDSASLVEHASDLPIAESWKLSSFWGDSKEYLVGTEGRLSDMAAPYRYRILPVASAKIVLKLTGGEPLRAWIFLNLVSVSLASSITALLAKKLTRMSWSQSLVTGILFVPFQPVMFTVGTISVDPLTTLISALLMLTFVSRKRMWFVVVAIAGVLTKEIFVVSGLAWLLLEYRNRKIIIPKLDRIKNIVVMVLPAATFVGVRNILGGESLEVSYGFDIANGEFPDYWERFISPVGIGKFVILVFFAWSVLWLGIVGVIWIREIRILAVLLGASLLVAVALFSGQVMRTMAPLGPILSLGAGSLLFTSKNEVRELELRSDPIPIR